MAQLAVQIRPWDQILSVEVDERLLRSLAPIVMIEMEGVMDLAHLVSGSINHAHLKTANLVRSATPEELGTLQALQHLANEHLEYCRSEAKQLSLPMKIIAAHMSFDQRRVVIGFTASARIDFRELVKKLHHHFPAAIRLQQVSPRDQLRLCGNIGLCGRQLCCQGLLKYRRLGLLDANNACSRCADRPNGACGRTKCCGQFEVRASASVTN